MNRTAVGLTRQSILLKWRRFSKMDTWIKPAYDGSLIAIAGISLAQRAVSGSSVCADDDKDCYATD
jgi:hypothetical protein